MSAGYNIVPIVHENSLHLNSQSKNKTLYIKQPIKELTFFVNTREMHLRTTGLLNKARVRDSPTLKEKSSCSMLERWGDGYA